MTRSNLCGWFLAILSPSAGGRCHPKEFTFSETGSNLHFVRRKTESIVTGQEEDAVHEHTSRSLCAEWSVGTAEARTERLLRTLAPFESPELAISRKEQVSMFEVSVRLTASFFSSISSAGVWAHVKVRITKKYFTVCLSLCCCFLNSPFPQYFWLLAKNVDLFVVMRALKCSSVN